MAWEHSMAETLKEIAEYQSDHDLLIVLNERVATLILAVNAKNGDHEERIRWLEKRGWFMSGGLLVVTTLIGWAIHLS